MTWESLPALSIHIIAHVRLFGHPRPGKNVDIRAFAKVKKKPVTRHVVFKKYIRKAKTVENVIKLHQSYFQGQKGMFSCM